MNSYDIYFFRYYSLSGLLNRLNDLHIEVKKYHVHKENEFYIKINRRYRKIIRQNFNDCKIVDKIGVINFFDKLISKPITFICLILSVCLFVNVQNRIYKIEIKGDYPFIEEKLFDFLKNNNIRKYSYGIDQNLLENIEEKIKEELSDELESIEIVKGGAVG